MKAYLRNLKSVKNQFSSRSFGLLQRLCEFNLRARFVALLLLTALITPMIFMGNWQPASAKSVAPIVPVLPALVSAPPEPFVLSSTNTISNTALSSVTSLNASVADFFSAPKMPEGFAATKMPSPFASLVSSIGSSVNSFFGFAAPSSKPANAATTNMLLYAPGSVKFDFDGDGKSDGAIWHPSTGQWKTRSSLNNTVTPLNLGTSGSVIVPADYDGDGKTDYATFKASTGTWTIKHSSDGTIETFIGGQTGDKPVSGDYDGDGKADIAIWRPSDGMWYFRQSSNNQILGYQLGVSTDIPVPGNYNGDSKMDCAVYSPSSRNWYVLNPNMTSYSVFQFGLSADIPVPADYDGDGKTDYATYRPDSGTWHVWRSSNNTYTGASWGNYGDQPVPADYDGDGKADFAVWRPTNGVWHILKSSDYSGQYFALGVAGDPVAEAAYLKQTGSEVYSYDFARIRLSPKNATGGTNLYSRNFSWGTGLAGLPGRAGMDAGFGISYNSLVWTKSGSTMIFDADKSNVAPGFQLGYPTIEADYYDSVTGKFNYLMVTPSGAKVEFKQQAGASNIYETADSSYTQLKINSGGPNDPAEDLTLTVTGTDGTQMSYAWIAGAYRCTQIKDANGNYITIGNNEKGLLETVTDTLGRIINVEYDSDFNPTKIWQNWQPNNGTGSVTPHTYALFYYGNQAINTSFGTNIQSIYGPQGVNIKVLQSIVYTDGSSTKFDYNSYGQVYKVSNYAADSHLLNYTKTNLETPAAGQTDCPRFTETRNWVENFNQNTSGVAQEVVINNSITENSSYAIGGASGTATKIEVSMTGEPNNRLSRTYVGASSWAEGLPLATEDLANENGSYGQRRWTTTSWTQDDTSLSYILNPRVIESKVGDATNVKRTTIDYLLQAGSATASLYGLSSEIKVYDSNQTTVLKRATTEYNLDNAYVSRRIIGLPAKSELYDGSNALVSKVTFAYDEGNFNDTTLNQNLSSAIQHDNTNYGAGFIAGRGNLTSTTRWNADYPASASEAVTSSVKYNTTGAVVAQITPGSTANTTRQVTIGYADSFNDNSNWNSFAYPTTLTDPAGFSSQVKYRYDTGANVWAKSPAPQNQTNGKETTRVFDSVGRLEKQTIVNNGAYTRYEYPISGVQSKVYSTITDTNANGADTADEVLSESWADGAGRPRQSRTELPNSSGGWSGTLVEYDILGQVKRQSVPTEINSSWSPAGDDLTRGWLWTSNEYDWKGRTTRTVNTDGTDKLISYDGCGCAGGQVTTVQGENIVESDWQGNAINTLGRRTRKYYADTLGRKYKTEILNWDNSVYSTIKTTYNGRDQETLVRQYVGTDLSSTFQDSTTVYDGHGRIYKTHIPQQQNANGTPAFTTYNYSADDSIQSIIDARGASINYTYNSRSLLEQINSTVPTGSNIPIMSPVTFNYDGSGNRIHMNDGVGQVDYEYDQLSRLQSENRQFPNITNASSPDGKYKLSYEYTLSGALKSVTDPFNAQINYNFDKAGRTTTVTGTIPFAGITTYAS